MTNKPTSPEDYNQWIELLNSQEDPHYYENMIRFRNDIIVDIAYSKQKIVAEKLKTQPPVLAILLRVLKVM